MYACIHIHIVVNRRDQFTILVGYLAQNSPFSVRAWESQYERYYGMQLSTYLYYILFFNAINSQKKD